MSDPLLQPFQLKHLRLKNRILSTSHEPAYSEGGLPKRRYQLYHEEKAKGGCALTMIGGSAVVAPDSPQAFGNLHVFDGAIVADFKTLAARVHAYGCAVMCQITHLGRRTNWNKADWLPVMSPSPIREPAHRAFPKQMEDFDIKRAIRAYGTGARHCREGGLDGIEIEAYGHLLDAFWSPLTNRRDDDYGGSLENRMRFGLEALAEIRRQVGQDYIVGIRMVVDEDLINGLPMAEGLEIARRLARSGLIDFVNVIKGHIDTDEGLSHVIPGMGTPAGPHLDTVKRVREALALPVMHAARINDVATARHAVAGGYVDMVGMTRAHMADPHIVAKIMQGEEDRIRPCVGAGYCIDRIYMGGEALCLHNPATGREDTMPHVVPATSGAEKTVVVVGAGPAGLEAARVSAARGHKVVLFEAAARPGGQVILASKAPRRREIIGIVEWLFAETQRHGVDARFNVFAERADILRENPDIVVIATGGTPNPGFFAGAEDLAITAWDMLSGQVALGQNVLLYDDEGGHEALSCAEFISTQIAKTPGAKLEVMTPERMIGVEIGGINYPAYYKSLYRDGVVLSPNHRVVALRRDGNGIVATIGNEYDKSVAERRFDQVIAVHASLPADAVYFDLKALSRNGGEIDYDDLIAGRRQSVAVNPEGRFQMFRVGDAVAARNIHAAIYDSLRLCKEF